MKNLQGCDICGSKEHAFFLKKDSYSIVKCSSCGLIFREVLPTDRELFTLYSKGFFTSIGRLQYYIKDEYTNIFNARVRLKMVQRYKKIGTLLDIGCAFGTFLKVMQENNWEPWGSEISAYAANYAQRKKLHILTGDFLDVQFPVQFFHIITMWDYIEHVRSPYDNLIKSRKLLKKNGIVFISTPDIGSTFARILGKRWRLIKPKQHLYYFNKKTLFMLLEKTGFSVIEVMKIGRYFNLEYLLHTSGDTHENKYSVSLFNFLLSLNNKITFLPKRMYLNFGDIMTVVAIKLGN